MSKTTDKLIDDIIDVILVNMDCHHEVDHDEDGTYMSVEYSLNNEARVRGKIMALLKPGVTEEWIEEKARKAMNMVYGAEGCGMYDCKDFIRSLVEEMPTICKDWLPTVENINNLPEPVRKYIRDIETNVDPQGMVRENVIMKDTIKTLEKILEEKPEPLDLEQQARELFSWSADPRTIKECEDFIREFVKK